MVASYEAMMELEGQAAPPMANGEIIFDAPWQSRVFGMARVLCEAGHYSWDQFRALLIEQIAHWESEHADSTEDYPYFDCFLAALSDVLADEGLCETDLISARQSQFAARPHGHDH